MTGVDQFQRMEEQGVIITNSHVVLTGWEHGSAYFNKDAIYADPVLTYALCRQMVEPYANDEVDVVVAPALGGIALTQWGAFHLRNITGRKVSAVYAEKLPDGKGFIIGRGYDRLVSGKKALILEDVVTRGTSVAKVVELVRSMAGEVVGVSVLCNRGNIKPAAVGGVPRLMAVFDVNWDSWEAQDCPLCKENVPVNPTVGKGREFVAKLIPGRG